jgi:hypothetical protein
MLNTPFPLGLVNLRHLPHEPLLSLYLLPLQDFKVASAITLLFAFVLSLRNHQMGLAVRPRRPWILPNPLAPTRKRRRLKILSLPLQ